MKHALILVDIQNDFVAGGALAVRDGLQIVSVANELTQHFDFVVATQDWHPPNHGSFASQQNGCEVGDTFELGGLPQVAWPDHCVQGTKGAQFVETLNRSKIQHVIQKGTDVGIDSYSGFFDNGRRQATGLEALLRSHDIESVFIVGLATDYCVKFTALDAASLGFATHVLLDGCRGVELHEGDVTAAIREMENAGIRVEPTFLPAMKTP